MRYFTTPPNPVAWYEYEPDVWQPREPPAITVIPSEAKNTGLVDEHGMTIMKGPDRLGFLK